MRVFLDANVLFSAAKSDGAIRALLALLRDAGHELWADGYVIEEARRNVARKYPGAETALEAVLDAVSVAPIGPPARTARAAELPEKDRPVLEAAIRLRCDILMTGDKAHFGRLYGKAIDGVRVLAPAAVAEKLLR